MKFYFEPYHLLFEAAITNGDPYCIENFDQASEIMFAVCEARGATLLSGDERKEAAEKLGIEDMRNIYKAGEFIFTSFQTKIATVRFDHSGGGGNKHKVEYIGEGYWLKNVQKESDTIVTTDEDGKPLPEEDWQWIDGGGNVIKQGKEEIEEKTGFTYWDGDYDATEVVEFDELSYSQIAALYHGVYLIDSSTMSEALTRLVLDTMGYDYAGNIEVTEEYIKAGKEKVDITGMQEAYDYEGWEDWINNNFNLPQNKVEQIIDLLEDIDFVK